MNDLKVLFVCQWYKPEPVTQPGWIVAALQRRGVRVEVLTGVPNYPSGQVLDGYRPWTLRSEMVEGVRVHRTPLYPSHDTRALRRFANYASWALSSTLFGQGPLSRSDVALVYSSPATAATAAMFSSILGRTPYVLIVQDVWPDTIFSSGFLGERISRILHPLVNALVQWTYRWAAHVVVTSPGMRELLTSRGVPAEKIDLVYNWVDEEIPVAHFAIPGLRARLAVRADDFLLMYAGNHGAVQGLDVVVRAVGQLATDGGPHLVLIGDGVEKDALQRLAAEVGRGHVHFVEPQPKELIQALTEESDAQVVSLADKPLFQITTPSKLQSVLAAGKPVLVHASGDAAEIVLQAGAGLTAAAGDVEGLSAAIRQMAVAGPQNLLRWGQNGRAYYEEQMAESVGARRVIDLLTRAANSRTTRLPRRKESRREHG